MKRRGFWSLLSILTAALVVGMLSVGAGMARADLRSSPGPVAGLASDGTVYVTSTTDSFWHMVDPVTFTKLGYDRNDIKWYGTGGLPGSLAPDTVVTPAYQAFADLIRPPVNLVGLTSTGGVYISQPTTDTFWHSVTAGDFLKNGYSWSWVKWYGGLPGTIAP